ncbi:MAG: leucine-rich repeat protein, partial [Oscillospiraceae bacterium]|nr:leucine-rich repeat protein [Oscillospiraceae bacterium]
MKKRIASALSALVLALALVPLTAAAAEISGTCGDGLTWTLNGAGTLTISGEGAMEDYVYYGLDFSRSRVTRVVVGDWVTHIGANAFLNFENLTDVTIGHSVTSIGESAFSDCSSLARITIPENVTDIGKEAFCYDTALTDVELSEGVRRVEERAFYDCGFTAVTVPASVTYIGLNALDGRDLQRIDVSADNAAYRSRDGILFSKGMRALYCCPATKTGTYTVPGSVTQIGEEAFVSSALTDITVPASVTRIGERAFSNSYGRINVAADNPAYCSRDGVLFTRDMKTLIHYPWSRDGDYVIPDGVTRIEEDAFFTAFGLTGVTIPDSVTVIGGTAFYECDNLTELVLPDSVTAIEELTFGRCENLASVTIPSSVTAIGNGAFEECGSLADVYYTGSRAQWNAISIGESNDCLTDAAIHFTGGDAPAVITQPRNVTADQGAAAVFSVEADGTGPLSFQWYYKNAGASAWTKSACTAASWSFPASAAASGRQVYCAVTDGAGRSVNSKTATLTVTTPLTIHTQPQSQTVDKGEKVTFSVGASGDGLTYQWYYRNAGASAWTKSTCRTAAYSFTALAATDGRQLRCEVTDAAGRSVTSDTAALTLARSLTIVAQPRDVTAEKGEQVSFLVDAAGDGLTYQWYY